MKRALFIGTPFFEYYRHIIAALEAQGFEVDFANDRPSENSFLKGAVRVRPSLVATIVDRYLDKLLTSARTKTYDLVFVVNGKVLTSEFMADLRAAQPGATFVLYLWDAVKLYPSVTALFPAFDRRYTFDPADARTYPGLALLPLFYTNAYGQIGDAPAAPATYDLANICTAHPNRYVLMQDLIPRLRARGLRIFNYLYLNPLQYAYNRVRVPEFRRARRGQFRFDSLSVDDTLQVVRSSRGVLDVNHAGQTGLTMRTIETLGARRKLVTTNTSIRDYDFYDPTRVLLLEDMVDAPSRIEAFLNEPMIELAADIYRSYGIDAWTAEIVTGKRYADGSLFAR